MQVVRPCNSNFSNIIGNKRRRCRHINIRCTSTDTTAGNDDHVIRDNAEFICSQNKNCISAWCQRNCRSSPRAYRRKRRRCSVGSIRYHQCANNIGIVGTGHRSTQNVIGNPEGSRSYVNKSRCGKFVDTDINRSIPDSRRAIKVFSSRHPRLVEACVDQGRCLHQMIII